MWKLRLGREGVCPSHLAGRSPATVPWPCCWPHQVSDGEERQDGCLTAPETALSTEGEWSAVLHGPHQAPWLDLGALAMVRNLLQAREWSCWPRLASHYLLSPEKKKTKWKEEWLVTLPPQPPAVKLPVWWAREVERRGRGAACLSEDKSLVPLWGRQDHICHSSWQCHALIPQLPQSCHGVWHHQAGGKNLQSAEGKLRVNPLPCLLAPRPMWRGDERGRMKYRTTGKAESSALPQPAFEGTGG